MKSRLGRALIAGAALLGLLACSVAAPPTQPAAQDAPTPTAGNLITLHYNERPPYLVTTDKGVGGLTGDAATAAFIKSGIPFRWVQTPSKRQIYLLQQNRGQDCLVGWFKNAERQQFAKFTLPVYQDQPQIALARADNDAIPSVGTVGEFFSNPRFNLLVKDGYSYGEFVDGMIQKYRPVLTVTTGENSEMLKMVYARHADYFLIAPEEAEGLITTSEFDPQDFKFIRFTDIPHGERRYILCSMQVDDALIERLNASIQPSIAPDLP